MTKDSKGIFGEEKTGGSIKEAVSKYLHQWPIFLLVVGISLMVAFFFIASAVPKYMATLSFLIIGKEAGNPNTFDLIENALNVKKDINVNNEMLLIGAQELMQKTVAKNNFNISYFSADHLQNIDIYNEAPFIFTVVKLDQTNKSHQFYIKNLTAVGGNIIADENGGAYQLFTWNTPVVLSGSTIILSKRNNSNTIAFKYKIQWQPVIEAADGFSKELVIKSYDSKTSVVQLFLKTANLSKGKDILNALFAEFNRSDIEARNNFSDSTVQFIDNRLFAISNDLSGVEGKLENYQGNNALVDIKGQSNQSLENLNTVSKAIKDVSVQQDVASMIIQYFDNPKNDLKLVPSSLGLADATLETLITQYNLLQLKREREAPSIAVNSTVMQDLNSQILSLKGSILESLNNIKSNLQLQQNKLAQENNQFKNFLSAVPHNERVLLEIKRRQTITEGLYLYLLQKREEAAISTTSAKIAHYKQIDSAAGYGPVEPNSTNIIMYTILLGFSLAFTFVYLRELLQDKIVTVTDIRKLTTLPIVGQIAQLPKNIFPIVPVLDRGNIGEQFRSVRTNVAALLKQTNSKVILVTSYNNEEGKSFVSLNLATVFAIPGKKVALLEFNFREPSLGKFLQIDAVNGIADYLLNTKNKIEPSRFTIDSVPGLHLFLCGKLPANAGDVLLSDNMIHLFKYLKATYDYIIIDTPAMGLFSDAQVLATFSDISIFVVRAKKSLKNQIDFISDLSDTGVLPNIGILLNDVETKFSNTNELDKNNANLVILKQNDLAFAQ